MSPAPSHEAPLAAGTRSSVTEEGPYGSGLGSAATGQGLGLRRRDLEPRRGIVSIVETRTTTMAGSTVVKAPKPEARRHTNAIPSNIVCEPEHHLGARYGIGATEARASIPMFGDHEPQRSAAIPTMDQNRTSVDHWARQPADGAQIGQTFRKSSRNPKVGMTAS